MRLVIQRVLRASVTVGGAVTGAIQHGVVVLAAVEKGDTEAEIASCVKKVSELRMFSDEAGKMNLSVREVGGSVLAISQFTLAATLDRGRRPGFQNAEIPARAAELYSEFVAALRASGLRVETGIFGAHMIVLLENDGPVTFIYDTKRT